MEASTSLEMEVDGVCMEASTSGAMEASTLYLLEHFPDEALRLAARMSKMRRSFRERGRMHVDQQNGGRGRERTGGSGDTGNKGGMVKAEKERDSEKDEESEDENRCGAGGS
jgi:hypothetical protein